MRSQKATTLHEQKLSKLESHPTKFLDNVIFATNLNVVDEHGNDVTAAVKAAVVNGVG